MRDDPRTHKLMEGFYILSKNAELKQTLDYGNAHACGMNGMTIQAAVSIFLVNLKRIKTLETSVKGGTR